MEGDKMRSKLALILVTHNESRFLINWIEKMLKQWKGELIVVDNASIDNTLEILKLYPNLTIIKSPKNLGPFGGFIKGCQSTNAEFVACYSPDDEIGGSYIAQMVEAMEEYPLVDLYTCNCIVRREGEIYARTLLNYTAYISPDYAVKICKNGYNGKINLCGMITKREVVLRMWKLGGKDMDVNFDCLFSFFMIFDKGFVNVGKHIFLFNSYPKSWGAARNRNKIWKSIKSQLEIYKIYPHVYQRAIESKICSKQRHIVSGLAVKLIMYLPKWIRKLLYNKIYDYKWEIEKL
jgi:glycosyltransferase involved in cell wall biosynthesis